MAGEFFVLAELALRGFDGTLTLGHTKEVDVLVLNRQTGRMFKVEVKATGKGLEHSREFGQNYAWLMSEKHSHITDADLVYAFVLLEKDGTSRNRPRFFLVPSREVAEYIEWNHAHHLQHVLRRRNAGSLIRVFRIPVGEPTGALPASWSDERWRRWEGNWDIFGRHSNS